MQDQLAKALMINPIPYTVNVDVKLRPLDLYSHRRTDIPGVQDECIFLKQQWHAYKCQ